MAGAGGCHLLQRGDWRLRREVFRAGDDHGSAGVGPAEIYFDALDGRILGDRQPWTGTLADIFVQAQFPLHSGRILGLPGRILVSIMGIIVAAVSITGVLIYARKLRARRAVESIAGLSFTQDACSWARCFSWRAGLAEGAKTLAARLALDAIAASRRAFALLAPVASATLIQIGLFAGWAVPAVRDKCLEMQPFAAEVAASAKRFCISIVHGVLRLWGRKQP